MFKRIKGFTLIELLIVVAIIAILAAIAVPNFLEAQTRAKVARVRSDLRTLATALEAYYIDAIGYPAQSSSWKDATTWPVGNPPTPAGVNDSVSSNNPSGAETNVLTMPTFRRQVNQADRLMTLTTPVSYITSYPPDPFADTKGATFMYSRGPNLNAGWIMWSYGPDGDEKVKNGATPDIFGGDIRCQLISPPIVETAFYNPGFQTPTAALTNVTYDPTNGTTSNGDVYRTKE
jgi:prepilin-type N-terminal cleavage/methylation domain-containing protein